MPAPRCPSVETGRLLLVFVLVLASEPWVVVAVVAAVAAAVTKVVCGSVTNVVRIEEDVNVGAAVFCAFVG
jgi:hypothetical protein